MTAVIDIRAAMAAEMLRLTRRSAELRVQVEAAQRERAAVDARSARHCCGEHHRDSGILRRLQTSPSARAWLPLLRGRAVRVPGGNRENSGENPS